MIAVRCLLLTFLLGWARAMAAANEADWTTPAEAAHFRSTPTYAQTRAWLERLATAAPESIRLTRFGVSPEGRDLMLVVAAPKPRTRRARRS